MNSPEMTFWLETAGVLALEITLVVLAVFAAQRWIRSGFWRRGLWQLALILTVALTLSELSGLGKGTAVFLFGRGQPERKFTVEFPAVTPSVAATAVTSPEALAESTPMPAPVSTSGWTLEVFWMIGIAAVLLRIAFAHSLFFILRFRRSEIDDASLKERVALFGDRLGIRRPVRLLQSPGLSGPIAFGILRPTIGLPLNFTSDFDRSQQDAMLAHELAHLAARDPFWYLLADLASALLCWHPLIWWARRRLHAASELAADEATLILENGPVTLAECLVSLGKKALTGRWEIAVSGSEFSSNLGQRVERLLALQDQPGKPIHRRSAILGKAAMMTFLAAGLILASGWIQGQDVPKAKTLQATLQRSWNNSAGGTFLLAALESSSPATPAPASPGSRAIPISPAVPLEADSQETNLSQRLTIQVRYIELDDVTAKALGADWLCNATYTNRFTRQNLTNACVTGILPEHSCQLLLKAVESTPEVDLVTSPKVTTASGRRILIHPPENVGISNENGRKVAGLPGELSLEVSPLVRADGRAIHLTLKFLGRIVSPTVVSCDVWDRQTVAIAGLVSDDGSREKPKKVIALVSPVLIGENGAPVHSEQDIGAVNSIPPQFGVPESKAPPVPLLALNEKGSAQNVTYEYLPTSIKSNPVATNTSEQLYTRNYKVDMNTFLGIFPRLPVAVVIPSGVSTSYVAQVSDYALCAFFKTNGVNLEAPKMIMINERDGAIQARGTLEDLAKIEAVIQTLNRFRAPHQLIIEAKFVEVEDTFDLDSLFKEIKTKLTRSPSPSKREYLPFLSADRTRMKPTHVSGSTNQFDPWITAANVVVSQASGILSDPEFRSVIRKLEQHSGADLLSMPRVTTLSGRQTRIACQDMVTLPESFGTNKTMAMGPVMDIMPTVRDDGYTIEMVAIPSVTELVTDSGEPSIRVRQMLSHCDIRDGQTLMLSGDLAKDGTGKSKKFFVFVTLTLIDPAGNRLHTEEELSKLPDNR